MMAGTVQWGDTVRMGLTYLVPFFVATYGALSARAETERKKNRSDDQ